jgi:hypothetical protein
MSEKTIHVVFQVLNFLHGSDSIEYKLLPIDKLILINLASHKGIKGIFPSQQTISKELKYDVRELRRRLKHLEDVGLIYVDKVNRKNYYYLRFLYELSTIEGVQPPYKLSTGYSIEGVQPLSYRVYSPPMRGCTAPPNNKVITKKEKRGVRNTSRPSPFPKSFYPDKQSIQLAQELKIAETILDSFKDYVADKGLKSADWNARFRKYLRDEVAFGRTEHLVTDDGEEMKPAHRVQEPHVEERYERKTDDVAVRAMKDIFAKLNVRKANGNGLASTGNGKTTPIS